ncbi:MAG: hypothetical protein A2004_09720 [Spirochaetes bacterium GWC1_61_12]|nr:MAG: hypothetical protein A2Y37_10970 [Spirochaetes bacterium GWB1_60_80]OHD33707.1 MAG: hypothetical protein A2004_09720 [Spirochaetes bacterium GWC1_61_12]OHD44959.1 MAG: hypothetical protein A2Y35_13010 [Spirochaetes bacterium GWE1_60_18]OHD60069.1 MAG: hypothetical protein A2Y32_11125 [Spirochaetes bacterium GWF1_60_12]HAP43630.1 hypothetical protein [Spirochaetaceae bacterium]
MQTARPYLFGMIRRRFQLEDEGRAVRELVGPDGRIVLVAPSPDCIQERFYGIWGNRGIEYRLERSSPVTFDFSSFGINFQVEQLALNKVRVVSNYVMTRRTLELEVLDQNTLRIVLSRPWFLIPVNTVYTLTVSDGLITFSALDGHGTQILRRPGGLEVRTIDEGRLLFFRIFGGLRHRYFIKLQ